MAKITVKYKENNKLAQELPVLSLKDTKHVSRGNKYRNLFFISLTINLLLSLYFLTTYIR